MKKLIGIFAAMGILTGTASAQNIKKLPDPVKTGGMPLMEVIESRRSLRDFSNREVDDQTLSDILWVAYGVSGDEGRRTIPTAQNKRDLEVYAIRADGAWKYDAENNSLIQVSSENLLPEYQAKQDYMKNVTLVLVYTGTIGSDWAALHAGSAYQNVGLYTTSKGMKSVVRGFFDKKITNKSLNLPRNQTALITQAVGW